MMIAMHGSCHNIVEFLQWWKPSWTKRVRICGTSCAILLQPGDVRMSEFLAIILSLYWKSSKTYRWITASKKWKSIFNVSMKKWNFSKFERFWTWNGRFLTNPLVRTKFKPSFPFPSSPSLLPSFNTMKGSLKLSFLTNSVNGHQQMSFSASKFLQYFNTWLNWMSFNMLNTLECPIKAC